MKTRTSKPPRKLRIGRSGDTGKFADVWDKEAAQKRLDELARDQGLGDWIPDYVALATAIWPTKRDVEEFDEWFSEIRRKGTASTELDD